MEAKICLDCGKDFHVKPKEIGTRKFCSSKCQHHHYSKMHSVTKQCPICLVFFHQRNSRAALVKSAPCCSRECANKLRLGKNTRPGYVKHNIDNQEIARLYVEEKWAADKIGQYFNVSGHAIAFRLKSMGVPIRSRSEATRLHAKRGPDCHWWKGGKRKDGNGYVIVRLPNHRLANAGGYVKEHHLVWQEHHKKELPKGWIVHHLNGVRDDNRPENLVALGRIPHIERENGAIAKKRIKQLEAENAKLKARLALLN